MEYIDRHITMYDVLNTPGIPKSKRGIVDPNICELKLEALYGELGDVLKLSRLYLAKIGFLNQIDDFTREETYRLLSMPMNELLRLGSLPQSRLPQSTFNTTPHIFKPRQSYTLPLSR
jgi:hypothetical protein